MLVQVQVRTEVQMAALQLLPSWQRFGVEACSRHPNPAQHSTHLYVIMLLLLLLL
jgi:hypothetical protein